MHVITPQELNNSLNNFCTLLINKYFFAGYCLKDLYNLGFRYNELYNRANISMPDPNHYLIITEKGSNPRTIAKTDFSNFWNNNFLSDSTAFIHCRCCTMQRLFNRYYLYKNTKVDTKSIKTHLFRHNRIKQMHLHGMSDNEIALYFGEVNIANIQNYINSTITCD
jgi:hypothetical protein